ncbi:MAG: glycosyltransferase family 2 protein [Sphingomicrobium sp.]
MNYRTPELTMRCVASLAGERNRLPRLRAVVVDGGSQDGSSAVLEKALGGDEFREWVTFIPLAVNGGFGWANNQAILTLARDPSPPDYVHVLNPDTEVAEGAVMSLVAELEKHGCCGAAGSQLLTDDGQEAASAFRFPSSGREFVNAAQSTKLARLLGIAPTVVGEPASSEADWVSGASVMLRSAALREVGLFDDGFFLYFEEVELMHRLRSAGWTVRHVPQSRIVHAEGFATGVRRDASRPMPRYWYESRRRYFMLTRGRRAALTADFASLAGRALGIAKQIVRRYSDRGIRTGKLLQPSFGRVKPSVPAWGDAPGAPPAWMARR